jgi:hypothetical protein
MVKRRPHMCPAGASGAPTATEAAQLEQHLARMAAEAAAALGGELCPATTASLAHCLSQRSRAPSSSCHPPSHSNNALTISRAPSSYMPCLATAHSSRQCNANDAAASSPLQAEQSASLLASHNGVSAGADASAAVATASGERVAASRQQSAGAAVSEGALAASSSRQLSRQLTGWLANTLLAVPLAPDTAQQQQHPGSPARMLHEALLSPGAAHSPQGLEPTADMLTTQQQPRPLIGDAVRGVSFLETSEQRPC